jgi:hypothetical protein
VRVTRCGDKGDRLVAFGSVTNNTQQERALRAAIAFKTSAGATQFTAVEHVGLVAPGETAYWAVHDGTDFKPAACAVVMSAKPKP